MKVVWKRPDGFHGANPGDFYVLVINEQINIWLHKNDNKNFPLRISGGWQDEDATQKLNQLINLLDKQSSDWEQYLKGEFSNSHTEQWNLFIRELITWVLEVEEHLKGDDWEKNIMKSVLNKVAERLGQLA